jgi:hypothetical protein
LANGEIGGRSGTEPLIFTIVLMILMNIAVIAGELASRRAAGGVAIQWRSSGVEGDK